MSAIGTDATALWDAGARIDSTFNSLSAYCKAPEAEKLFATTKPVAAAGDELCDELGTVASALAAYADEVRPLVATLDRLRQEARAFRASVAHDDDWREDGDKVEENNDRRSQVDAAWAAFQAAERDCHAKIVKLVGGDPLTVDDGSHEKGMYGYRAEDLDQAQGLPWGDPVDEETPWYRIDQHAWNFVKGFFVDGVWGTIRGLGTLVGVDGWDTAGQAWKGLGQLLTGIAPEKGTLEFTAAINTDGSTSARGLSRDRTYFPARAGGRAGGGAVLGASERALGGEGRRS
ncbi:hypothetical protein [Streptomyces sp. NRRL S-340]|uniref:hypothetical protein n=1 Tax=Streptomyces sp. NRRL S-340 TaxID=1463901 RepID=UPI00056741DB|nr:hypothetical protein [Streptomyces sp. NRRL S-340]